MINSFVLLILDVFSNLLSLLLKPIDLLLENLIPDYSSLSVNVVNLFNYLYSFIVYIFSWLHIPADAINILVLYLEFKVALFFGSLTYKLVVKWYHVLKS